VEKNEGSGLADPGHATTWHGGRYLVRDNQNQKPGRFGRAFPVWGAL